MRRGVLVGLVGYGCLMQGVLCAQEYTFRPGLSGTGAWTTASNWSPAGVPNGTGEAALFGAGTASSATLNAAAEPTTVTLAAGYPGTVTVNVLGSLTAEDILLTSGTLLSTTPSGLRARRQFHAEGGLVSFITCSGEARINGGTITMLRLDGAASTLRTDAATAVLGGLEVSAGVTTQSRVFLPATYRLQSGARHVLGPLSSLVLTVHAVEGELELRGGSALLFSTGASIPTGTVDASAPGSAIVCNGDWNFGGTWLDGDTTATVLTINQANGSSVIDHGANRADAVIVRGNALGGAESRWASSNEVALLSVLANTRVVLEAGRTLRAVAGMTNLGLVVVEEGAVLAVQGTPGFLGANGLPVGSAPVGGVVSVRLADGDGNLDGTVAEVLSSGLAVRNLRSGDQVLLSATETGPASSLFLSPDVLLLPGSDPVADEALQVLAGDVLRVSWSDPEDPSDRAAFADLSVTGDATATPSATPPPSITPTSSPAPTSTPTGSPTPTPAPSPTSTPPAHDGWAAF